MRPPPETGSSLAREVAAVGVVAHPPDEGGADVDALPASQALEDRPGGVADGSQPWLWTWGSLATKRAGA